MKTAVRKEIKKQQPGPKPKTLYDEGAAACRSGCSRGYNPCSPGSQNHTDWDWGWVDQRSGEYKEK